MNFAIKCLLVIFVSFALLSISTGAAFADVNLNAFIGAKTLDETEWAPVDEHGAFGVEADFGKKGSTFRYAVNLIGSIAADDTAIAGIKVIGQTLELQLGVKSVFGQGVVRPFFGGGLTIASASLYLEDMSFPYTDVEDSDSGMGVWLSAGVVFALGHFNIGLEAGYSTADVTIFGVDVDAGGPRVGLLFGANW